MRASNIFGVVFSFFISGFVSDFCSVSSSLKKASLFLLGCSWLFILSFVILSFSFLFSSLYSLGFPIFSSFLIFISSSSSSSINAFLVLVLLASSFFCTLSLFWVMPKSFNLFVIFLVFSSIFSDFFSSSSSLPNIVFILFPAIKRFGFCFISINCDSVKLFCCDSLLLFCSSGFGIPNRVGTGLLFTSSFICVLVWFNVLLFWGSFTGFFLKILFFMSPISP